MNDLQIGVWCMPKDPPWPLQREFAPTLSVITVQQIVSRRQELSLSSRGSGEFYPGWFPDRLYQLFHTFSKSWSSPRSAWRRYDLEAARASRFRHSQSQHPARGVLARRLPKSAKNNGASTHRLYALGGVLLLRKFHAAATKAGRLSTVHVRRQGLVPFSSSHHRALFFNSS